MKKIVILILLFILNACLISTYNTMEKKSLIAQESQKSIMSINNDKKIYFSYLEILYRYYDEVIIYANEKNIEIEITFLEFHDNYYKLNLTLKEYLDYYKQQIDNHYDALYGNEKNVFEPYSSGSGGDYWFYDTGLYFPMGYTPRYEDISLNSVRVGDILFEAKGFAGLTGHIAIVEGVFFDSFNQKFFIRVIEATKNYGVCRGVLDDQRFVDRQGSLYFVPNATTNQRNNAVNFCSIQLNKKYQLDFAKDTSSNELDWYCSELVWAGYMGQGIDIEYRHWTGLRGEPGVSPRDIKGCDKVAFYESYND